MHYALTQHARDVLLEREIDADWMTRVLDAPQRVEPDLYDPELVHHLGVIQECGNRVLRVVVNMTVSPVRVVTVFFDRGMRGRL